MSANANPQTPPTLQSAIWERLQDVTPIRSHDAKEDSSKTNCQWLIEQNWWGNMSQQEVEGRRREKIKQPEYYRVRIGTRLKMLEDLILKSGLQTLFKTADALDGLLFGLGAKPDDFKKAEHEIPDTEKEYWDAEHDFQRDREDEVQRSGYNYDDSPLASPTRTPPISLEPRSVDRTSLPSKAASQPDSPGVSNTRVQKKRHSKYTKRKQRSTRASKRLKASLEDELNTSAFVESASGKGPTMTTLSEKAVPFARPANGRVGTKTKANSTPHQSEGTRKSTRIQKKQKEAYLIEERTKPIIRGYHLRSKDRDNMTR
ncbi:hypothetical protein AYL99_12009 [Fonsecaea erecta]|uniref:Uncharacterized protein n=1 Tax=Fonsecaea erecta TaxID=1367422 RepID=A0A178Z1V7_9EURO|nr:hypothetical protein AYL99_12009 [Fonsecaea erecta]OAP53790.1 hypothetical protein AYL99_12009 [Fonsecaea erecta]